VKRITKTISDESHKDLHEGKFGSYSARKFTSEDDFHNCLEIVLGKDLWAKLGQPHNIKVTITVVD
jgi:hypothetical protein